MEHRNTYEDPDYAIAYAKLEFPGTYYLAFRDLPNIFASHIDGTNALDFGCGAGRSTRFLIKHGFKAVGIDISQEMVARAHELDPTGSYVVVPDGDLSQLENDSFDLILSAFAFDNIHTARKKTELFRELRRIVRPTGRIVNLVSTPEIYVNEWASFSTKLFPKNRDAKSGDTVKIVVTALDNDQPVEDYLLTDQAYREVYENAGLRVVEAHKPLGRPSDPCNWISEEIIAPWAVYVLAES